MRGPQASRVQSAPAPLRAIQQWGRRRGRGRRRRQGRGRGRESGPSAGQTHQRVRGSGRHVALARNLLARARASQCRSHCTAAPRRGRLGSRSAAKGGGLPRLAEGARQARRPEGSRRKHWRISQRGRRQSRQARAPRARGSAAARSSILEAPGETGRCPWACICSRMHCKCGIHLRATGYCMQLTSKPHVQLKKPPAGRAARGAPRNRKRA